MYSNFILQWIDLLLEGRRRGFSLSSSVSYSITRLGFILQLHLSSLTLVLYFYYLLFMFMHQSSYWFIAFYLLLFCTQIGQSKNNLAIIFNWGSKQALVFSYKFELSLLFFFRLKTFYILFLSFFFYFQIWFINNVRGSNGFSGSIFCKFFSSSSSFFLFFSLTFFEFILAIAAKYLQFEEYLLLGECDQGFKGV